MSKHLPSPITWTLILLLFAGCTSDSEPTSSKVEGTPGVPELKEQWTLDTGLDRPESVIYDQAREVLYVTNISGDAAEMDGNGYISRVSLGGEMLEQNWIAGLNAPKGIAMAGNRLWASDINALVEIDLESGNILERYSLEGDVYLNDVTVHPGGDVYVTDSRYSKIYRLSGGQLDLWLENNQIKMPNGAHVIGDGLVVVAGDASAENPGQSGYFQAISLNEQRIRSLEGSTPDGALDAVEPDENGGIFTTDWLSGRLMYFMEGQGTTLLKQLGQGSADVDYVAETSMLYVPVMQEGQLIAYIVD